MEEANKNLNNHFFLYEGLLESLKEKGFSVDIEDYVVIAQLKDQLLDGSITFDEYKFYLTAIICRTEDEQREFYLLFENELEKKKNELHTKHQILKEKVDDIYNQKAEEEKNRREKIRRIVIIVLSCLSALAIVILLFMPIIKTDDYSVKDFRNRSVGHITTDTPIVFSIYDNPKNLPKSATHQSCCERLFGKATDTTHLKVKWYIEGDTISNSTINYKFKTPGKKTVEVTFGDFDTIPKKYPDIMVCEPCPKINIPKKIYQGEDTKFVAKSSKKKPFVWVVDGQKVISNDSVLIKQFEKGEHHISCKTEGQQCVHNKNCDQLFTVIDRNEFKIDAQVIPPGNPKPSYSSFFYTLVLLLVSLFVILILTLFVPYLYEKYANLIRNYFKKLNHKKAEKYLNNVREPLFIGNKPPIDISFFNKERLIKRKEAIRQLGLDFQKRIATEDSKLNLPVTINASIKNYGLITPLYQNKNKKQSYLIIIDTSNVNSPLVKLHIFVSNYLKNYPADFEVYYYYKDPLKVYKKDPETTIDINTLKNKFYESVLIVFGDGYNFLDPNFGEVYKPATKEYSYWIRRVLITPIPSDDWSVSEKILASFFHIVPVDDGGLLSIFSSLQKGSYNQKIIGTKDFNSYSINYVDFENIEELKYYITKNTKEGNVVTNPLFQWICAIAVYPKITWEIILTIGAAIDENMVTYENVLKICRIAWVQHSMFPTQIRLELLKELDLLVEIKARKTIIVLLEEESVILPDTFSDNERKIQLTYNKFILYAIDPKEFLKYQDVEKEFLKLYQQEKFIDLPLKVYLQGNNPMKPSECWKSPLEINETKNLDHLEYYYNTKTKTISKQSIARRIKKSLFLFCLLSLVSILAIIFVGANDLGNKKSTMLVELERNQATSSWKINLVKNECYNAFNPQRLIVKNDAKVVFEGVLPAKSNSIKLKDFQNVYNHKLVFQLFSDTDKSITKTIKAGQEITLKITSEDCTRIDALYYGKNYEIYKDILEKLPLKTKNDIDTQIPNSVLFSSEVDSSFIYKLCLDLIKKKYPLQEIIMEKNFINNKFKKNDEKILFAPIKTKNSIITTESELNFRFYKKVSNPIIYLQYYPKVLEDSMNLFYRKLINSKFKNVEPKFDIEDAKKSEVRYFFDSHKNTADELAKVASSFFGQQIVSAKVIRNPKNQIEVWIKKGEISICKSKQSSDKKYIIYFDSQKVNLPPDGAIYLDKTLDRLRQNPNLSATIISYSSESEKISKKWLNSVVIWLLKNGINSKRIGSQATWNEGYQKQKCFDRIEIEFIDNRPPLPKILWVDDHPENNSDLINKFESIGIEVDIAKTNSAAIANISKNNNEYDFIITDIGRNNDEKAVSDKAKAGVELINSISDKSKIIIFAYAETIKKYQSELLKNGVTHFYSDFDELERYILGPSKESEVKR